MLYDEVKYGARDAMAGMPPGLVDWREGLYLAHLARDRYEGAGEIIDAGSFLGGSTWALSLGVRQNPRSIDKAARVHAFDRFVAWDEPAMSRDETAAWIKEAFAADVDADGRFHDSFVRNVGTFIDHVAIHEGSLEEVDWQDGPIEILFVDAGKTMSAWQAVLAQFYTALVPGGSVVVHQDWHHAWLPYLVVCQESFADSFRLAEPRINDTASFDYVTALPRRLLDKAIGWDYSADEQVGLMERAIARFARHGTDVFLHLAHAELLRTLGRGEAAAKVLAAASPDAAAFADDAQFARYRDSARQIAARLRP